MPHVPSQNRDTRFVDLTGTHNFRRVETWRGAGGARLRPGLLFRSSGLEDLTPYDSLVLAPLAIAHVFDLRSQDERHAQPSRWHTAKQPLVWNGAHCAAAANLATLIHGPTLSCEELRGELMAVYRAFPEDLAPALRTILQTMTEGRGPVLVHCAAGKDRTGFVIAMILRALDIHEADVEADYLMTNESLAAACIRFQEREHIAALEARTPGAIKVLLGAHRAYLHAADDAIRSKWGTASAYLHEMAGLDEARRKALRERLLETR